MKVIKRVNNNAAMCLDSKGRPVVAFGKGVGFTKVSEDLPLSSIERTFYNVDAHYLALIDEIPADVLSYAMELADAARAELPYELGPNLAFALADHISFALERTRRGMNVKLPITYDIAQQYPLEMRLGELARNAIRERFSVNLPETETAGLAMCLINNAFVPQGSDAADTAAEDEAIVREVTRLIESRMGVTIDRGGFGYARFATHMHYLLRRLRAPEDVQPENSALWQTVSAAHPDEAACAAEVAECIYHHLACDIGEDERLYLLLHIDRMLNAGH